MAVSLEKLQFQTMLRLADGGRVISPDRVQHLRDNLPAEFRDKIIRKDKCPIPGCTNTKKVWIWGHGENETIGVGNSFLNLKINQDPSPGWCFCGSRIKREGDTESLGSDSLSSFE